MKPTDIVNGCDLYLGDCLDILPTLGRVDAVVTDPPYGVGKADWDIEFPTDWIEQGWRVSDKMLVMTGNSAMIYAGEKIGRFKDCVVMQSRNGMTLSKVSFGNWFPVLVCGEWKWEARPNFLPFNVDAQEYIDHPSPKPLSAMRKLIEYYTKSGDLILDCFLGSGTTGVACIQTGRRFIGIEKDPKYYEIAKRRILQAQPPLFVDAPAQPLAVQAELV